MPKPWERYLEVYKADTQQHYMATPSQTQRAFTSVLGMIGSPARECKPRGNPLGRSKGDKQALRKKHKLIFKKKGRNKKKHNIIDSEKTTKISDPQKIENISIVNEKKLQAVNDIHKTHANLSLDST